MLKNMLVDNYFEEYNEAKKNLKTNQEEVSDKLKQLKECVKEKRRSNKYKYVVKLNDELIEKWNKNLEDNFVVNSVELFTIRKTQKFMIEVFSLYIRTVQAIERDFMLLINYKKNNNLNIQSEKNEISKYVDIELINKYIEIRNSIAHYNYFNNIYYEKSLYDLYKDIRFILEYNVKRKKAFKLSLQYIFEKNNMILKKNHKDEFIIESQKHQYAYKGIKKSKNLVENNTDWKKLKLLSDKEIELFRRVFNYKNNNEMND